MIGMRVNLVTAACLVCLSITGPLECDETVVLPAEVAPCWKIDGPPREYLPENLYEYVNGEAELYHKYGFVRLLTATYLCGGDKDHSIALDAFRMSSAMNAFGIYSVYRGDDLKTLEAGGEGFAGDFLQGFVKGEYFVKVSGFGPAEQIGGEMSAFAKAFDKLIPGSSALPPEAGVLNGLGIAPRTLRYYPGDYLGHAFLPAALEAAWKKHDISLRVFSMQLAGADEAGAVFKQYSGYIETESGEVHTYKAGNAAFYGKDPVCGEVFVVLKDSRVMGVIGDVVYDEAATILGVK